MQKYGGNISKERTKSCWKETDRNTLQLTNSHSVCFLHSILLFFSQMSQQFLLFKEVAFDAIKRVHLSLWLSNFELTAVFVECEQFDISCCFVSSCFHGLQAHIGLSHWNCCFSLQVGISRSPP